MANVAEIIIKVLDQATGPLGAITGGTKELTTVLGIASLAIGGLGAAAGKSALDFQTMSTQIQNNTTMTNADVGVMNETIKKLSAESGAPLDQLANGFMHAFNMAGNASDATTILDTAMKSAISTGSDVSSTTESLAKVMHQFAIPVGDAAKTMDELHIASALGNTTLEEFVNNSAKSFVAASNLGVPLKDVLAGFVGLTRAGYDASEANTQLAGILTHIITPTAAARKEIQALSKATGIDLVKDFSLTGIQSKGLVGVLQDLETATHGNEDAILKLIPAQRGAIGALALTGNSANDVRQAMTTLNSVIDGSSTPTLDAYTRTTETAGFKWEQLKAQFHLTMIELGTNLLPAITSVSGVLKNATQFVADHKAAQVALVETLGIVVTAFAALKTAEVVTKSITMAMQAAKLATQAWTAAQWLLNVALDANPIGIIIVALAALAAGIVYAYQNSETFRRIVGDLGVAMKALGGWIKDTFGPSMQWLGDQFNNLGVTVNRFTSWFTKVFGPGGDIGQAFDAFGKKANEWVGPGGKVGSFFDSLGTTIHDWIGPGGKVGQFFDHFGTIVQTVFWQKAKDFVQPVIDFFTLLGDTVRDWLGPGGKVGSFFDNFGTKVQDLWQKAKDFVKPIGDFFDDLGTKIHDLLGPLGDLIGKLGHIPGVKGIGSIIGGLSGNVANPTRPATASIATASLPAASSFAGIVPQASVASSQGALRGGDTYNFHIHVAGSVIRDNDIADTIYTALLRKQRQIGSLGFK